MAKKKETEIIYNETIIERTLEDMVHESMMPYAEHVILERALPRVEDGLKPVQRRILFTMHEMGLTPDKPYRKCATVVGDCMGKYHPHGDSSVYDALARMAQGFNMRGTLVDGHGNFGSVDGDRPAAMRYTECRMAPLALELLADLEKDTVDFGLNYDDRLKEPEMLPGAFPNLLVNGASGIAVGLATNIPTHNLGETIDAVIAQIDNPEITTQELLRCLPGPDFPTGALLVGGDPIDKIYETGRGRLILRAKTQIEPGSAGRKLIVITELPYQVNKASMLAEIGKLAEAKKAALSGIYDVRDESDREGMRAVIELRRDADPERILNYLYKYTGLQASFGVNMVAIADGKPVQMGLKAINEYYIRHRRQVVTRATQYELDGAKARAHVLEGLMVAVKNIDEVVRLIRSSKTPKEARELLMIRFALTEIQAQAILDLRLQRLTGLEIEALKKEYDQLKKRIKALEAILKSEKKLLTVIKEQLIAVKDKYADPRRTQILENVPAQIQIEEVSEAMPTLVAIAKGGFIKRMSARAFSRREETDGMFTHAFDIMTDHKLLFFTDQGNCFTLLPEQIAECRLKDRGMPYVALLAGLAEGEQVVDVFSAAPNASEDAYLFVTRGGMVKCTKTTEYGARRGKNAAITLKGDDRLVKVLHLKHDQDLVLLTLLGMVIRVDAAEIPVTGRVSAGVKGVALEIADSVCFAGFADKTDELVFLTERGYGKRMPLSAIARQKRAGKGQRCFQMVKGGMVGTQIIGATICADPAKKFFAIQKSGMITPLSAGEMMAETRTGKGMPYIMVILDDIVTELVLPM